jgi:hypothetical protein
MTLGGHHREGLVVRVDDTYGGVHGHPAYRGVDEQHLPRLHPDHRRIETVLRRLKLWEPLLPDLDNLRQSNIGAAQFHPVGLLPELAEALQRSHDSAPIYVQVDRAGRHLGDHQRLDRLCPESSVAKLFLAFFLLWLWELFDQDTSFTLASDLGISPCVDSMISPMRSMSSENRSSRRRFHSAERTCASSFRDGSSGRAALTNHQISPDSLTR